MIVIQDTREQLPLEFKHDLITEIQVMKLDVGDYCVKFKNGYIPNVRFERKSIGDLVGTLTSGHERFDKEIERSKNFDVRLIIIIEGTLTKVLKGFEHSKVEGDTIVKILFSLWERYNVMPVFCKDREECSRYIIEFYAAIGRKALKDLKQAKK